MSTTQTVVVLVYDGVAADEAGVVIDLLGGAGLDVVIASVAAASITSYHGRLVPQRRAADVGPVLALVVPGGMGIRSAVKNDPLLRAVATLGGTAQIVAATSTGSALIAAAGLAQHRRLTTHWLARDLFSSYAEADIDVVDEPFVEDGSLLTSSGVASTVRLSLRMIELTLGSEAADRASSTYTPRRTNDTRYRPNRSWRQRLRRRTVDGVDAEIELDPDGRADLIVLELD